MLGICNTYNTSKQLNMRVVKAIRVLLAKGGAMEKGSEEEALLLDIKSHTTSFKRFSDQLLEARAFLEIEKLDGERLTPDDPFVVGARLRLAYASRQRPTRSVIDMRDLLAFRTP